MAKRHARRWLAPVGLLGLLALLAACGQTSASLANGAKTPSAQPTVALGTPTPTEFPLPYSFPKKWLPAPDGADLPQWPALVGSFVFSPSAPQVGYFCLVSPDAVDDSPTTPPNVSVTADGGQTWQNVSGPTSRPKSSCNLFIDQTNPRDLFAAAGNAQQQEAFYRSQDGGATWKKINQPILASGSPTYIFMVAVVNSRLVIGAGIDGEAGTNLNPLYSSDDGGQSWQAIHASLNGQALQFGQQVWVVGTTLYAAAAPPCTGGCGALRAPINAQAGMTPLSQPLSSQPPPPNLYFKSTDGGRTWATIATPVSNLSNPSFVGSADGSTTYAIGSAPNPPGQYVANFTGYYSADGGVTWKQLPSFAGVEGGYPDPGSFGAFGAYVLPDGSVMSTTFHSTSANNGNDAGVFLLRPSDPAPAWRPLVRSLNGVTVQPVVTSAGVRVWGLTILPDQAGGFLEYFDLP